MTTFLSADDLRQRVTELVALHRSRCAEECTTLTVSFGPLVWHAADVLAVDLPMAAWEAGKAAGYATVIIE